MDPLRAAAYATHLLAAASLAAAARHTPSLRRPAALVALGLPLSLLTGAFTRADGRWLYHAAQLGHGAWLACVVAACYAPRLALPLLGAYTGAALAWWPAPAAPLYAAAQGLAVALAGVALYLEAARSRVPLPGHGAALVLAGSELACLVAPYLLATVLEEPVAALWDAARVVRVATWAALAVVGWASWRSSGSVSLSSWRASSRPPGEDGTRAPHREQPVSYSPRDGQRGSDGSAGGIDARG